MTHQNDLEQHLLIDLHELLIPLVNLRGLLAVVGILVVGGRRVLAVVLAPLNDLAQNGLGNLGAEMLVSCFLREGALAASRLLGGTYVGNGDDLGNNVVAKILEHVLDQKRALGDGTV